MAELKRVFSKAIMNKDMDERLVPNGQYRDALNIQISTSDDSDVGSVQTLLGNTKHNTMADASGYYGVADDSAVVASIAAADRDKIYYFVAAGSAASTGVYNSIKKDYILEYNALTKKHKYVFVDIYEVSSVVSANSDGNSPHINIAAPDTVNKTGVRIGMTVAGTIGATTYTHADNLKVSDIKYNSSHWEIYLEKNGVAFNDLSALNQVVEFKADRVLWFSKHTMITGINVLDNAIYWTDNSTEPKKVNIDRSIAGTGGVEYLVGGGTGGFAAAITSTTGDTFKGDTDYFHTRLVKDKAYYSDEIDQYSVVTTSDQKKAVYVEESHITVIKKSPTQPLEIEAYRTSMKRVNSSGTENAPYTSMSFAFTNENEHDVSFSSQVDYRVNDIIIIANSGETSQPTTFTEYNIRAKVIESNVVSPDSLALSGFKIEILSRKVGTTTALENYYVRLEDTEPLFEFKFPRFSYRYKYQDGEYSTFAPWSQIAFLPSVYEYLPKKGYNFGMVNQIRSLKLKRYHANENSMPEDVVEIDLLYKETNNPTVYTVKTIKRSDGDPLWPNLSNGMGDKRGEYVLTTDMVHAVVASNQLLRPWDNVPRKALAQEISANRLIYGNYVQNYTILKDPIINVSLRSEDIQDVSDDPALPSVKSLRTYQVGVVFSDKYGRETPVLTHEKSSIKTPKDVCGSRNRLSCSINNSSVVPDWADYYSYYIKETSVEYHTLAMDRWYDAWDGNIWLSFPSSDRNKVNEETFLELKSEHGGSNAVLNKARYKVLAIENEAPDYVKTTSESLGTLTNVNNSVGSSGGGYPTLDGTFITIQQGAFESVFGSDLNVLTPDNLGLRFYGGGSISKEYDVRRLTLDGTSYKISINDKFEDDIAFTSTGNSFDTGISDLVIELFDRKIENKPEFDGRFFVKIFKDESLNNYVLNYLGDPEMIVSDSFKLGYINNNGLDLVNTLGVPNLLANYLPDDGNSAYDNTGKELHPTEYDHHTPAYRWAGGATYDDTDNEVFFVTTDDINKNPIRAINDETSNTGSAAQEFWEGVAKLNMFFIDAATAYSFNGRDDNRPGRLGDSENEQWWNSGGDAEDDPNDGPTTGSMKKFSAQPSRGIWGNFGNDRSYMDISWSGMGEGFTDSWGLGQDDIPNLKMELKDIAGEQYEKAWLFIKKLVKEGTVFRFQKDPELTQYTVISTPHPTASTDYTNYNYDGYDNNDVYISGTNNESGAWGIRNYKRSNQNYQWRGDNLRQRWTIGVTPAIGKTNVYGYNPIHGTKSPDVGGPASTDTANYRRALKHDTLDNDIIEILEPFYGSSSKDNFTDNPAVWETEPKESVDLDIYYQASGLIPLDLVDGKNEELIPIGSTFTLPAQAADQGVEAIAEQTYTVTSWNSDSVGFTPAIPSGYSVTTNLPVTFKKRNYYELKLLVKNVSFSSSGATQKLTMHGADRSDSHKAIHLQSHYLDWNNCWAFGNGVESDRIRDDFNAPQLDNGVKASTVLAEQAREERRKHGLIWSGIYNSTSGVNNTNQFIMAEAITKDLNPIYGSIQALLNKDTRLVMLCEDKILRADTNKDLLFNADGSSNLVASSKVVGSASPYQGDYGISTNPESMVTTPYQTYFTDATRGHVIALSNQEGLRSVSSLGMKDYFSKLFEKNVWRVLGTYDSRKNEYNLTVSKKYANSDEHPFEQTTISYNELSKGWVSFKSFNPQDGLSLNNDYFTFDKGHIYIHHDNAARNTFYGTLFNSDITVLFNDNPGAVKSFSTINYEGTQAKVTEFDSQSIGYYNNNYSASGDGKSNGLTTIGAQNDSEYFNLSAKAGWYVDNVTTDMEKCKEIEFKEKEGKWFGVLAGESMGSGSSSLITDNKGEATVQGIGLASIAHSAPSSVSNITITVANNTEANTWDVAAVVATEASRWTCSSETLSVVPGSAITGGDKVDLTISNVIDGVNSGFPLSAADFEVPGATFTSSGSGNSTEYIYTVDDDTHVTDVGAVNWEDIDTITFKNNGNGGDLDNTVNVRVQFKGSGQTWPSVNATYSIDIDTKAGVSAETTRKACLFATYNYYLGQSVVTTNYSDITESEHIASGTVDAEDGPTNKHTGTVPDGSTTEIASYKFTASSDNYYGPVWVKWHNLGEYSDYYSHAITDEVYNASNLRTSWTARLYYTPPQNGSLVSDPEDMCNLGHLATAVYSLYSPEKPPGEGSSGVDNGYIHKVNPVDASITANGLSSSIEVTGDAGSKYNITVRRYASDGSINGYYNFTSGVFQTDEVSLDSQIPSQGVYLGLAYMYNEVEFPSNASNLDITYDVIISGLVDGVESTLSELVPVSAHDLDIIQYGISTASITAANSHDHTGNTYVADSIIRPKLFSRSGYKSPRVKTVSGTLSAAAGVGATKLVLSQRLKGVSAGDWVINPFGQTTGVTNAIEHLTQVVSVNGYNIEISKAVQAPRLEAGASISFVSNVSSVYPFEVKVTKAGGEANITAINTGVKWRKMIGGLAGRSVFTNGVTTNSKTITVSGTTRGILPGQQVDGIGVVGVDGATHTHVATVVDANNITVITNQTLPDDTILDFSLGQGSTAATQGGVESGMTLLHLQAHVSDPNNEAKIQGYLKIDEIKHNTSLRVYSDLILTQA